MKNINVAYHSQLLQEAEAEATYDICHQKLLQPQGTSDCSSQSFESKYPGSMENKFSSNTADSDLSKAMQLRTMGIGKMVIEWTKSCPMAKYVITHTC